MVIGCSGGGKSTLSRALSARLGLDYISMDREFFWLPGWRQRERADIRRLIADAVAGDRWIMDGTSPGTMDLRLPRTDLVIWIRMPRRMCLWRIVKRCIRYAGKSRPEMADGCPERLDPEFLRYVWNFERAETPEILAQLARFGASLPLVVLRKPAQVDALLARMGPDV